MFRGCGGRSRSEMFLLGTLTYNQSHHTKCACGEQLTPNQKITSIMTKSTIQLICTIAVLALTGCENKRTSENFTLKSELTKAIQEKESLNAELAKKAIEIEGFKQRLEAATSKESDLKQNIANEYQKSEALRIQLAKAHVLTGQLEGRILRWPRLVGQGDRES
jgi:uncharacterized protein YlxW (UPF0749 family)